MGGAAIKEKQNALVCAQFVHSPPPIYNVPMVAPLTTIAPEQELRRITRRIAETFQPDLVVLFGSNAYGAPDEDSDYDLLILKETDENRRERWMSFWNAVRPLDHSRPIEPIILTPAELQERLRLGDQFVQEIARQGVVLYARDPLTRARFAKWVETIQPMSPSESPIPQEWYEMAARDLKAARALLGDDEDLFVASGVLLQQAVEKYLKGYLSSKGWKLVRTHHLGDLLDALSAYESDWAEFKDVCVQLTRFYLDNRYTLKPPEAIQRPELDRLFVDGQTLVDRIQSRATASPAETGE